MGIGIQSVIERIYKYQSIKIGIIFLISLFSIFFGKGILRQVALLYPLAQTSHAYFNFSQPILFYILTPLIVLSGFIFILSPGLIWSVILESPQCWNEYIIKSFTFSFILLLISTAFFKIFINTPLLSFNFITITCLMSITGWFFLLRKELKGEPILHFFSDSSNRRRLLWNILLVLLGCIILLPKLFWENFNGDGEEMFHLAKSLDVYFTPTYTWENIPRGADVKFILPMYINNWMIHVFGDIEASVRLPFLLYVVLLFSTIIFISEKFTNGKFNTKEEFALIVSLIVFSTVMIYNASYNPWFSDIAAPAAHDSLFPVIILLAFFYFWQNNYQWFIIYTFLSYFIRPTASMFFLSFAFFTFLYDSNRKFTKSLLITGIFFVIAFLGNFLQQNIAVPAQEYAYTTHAILERIRYWDFFQFKKFGYALIPTGVIPFLSIGAFKWHSAKMKTLSLVTLIYFCFFYSMGFSALHHFVPVMIFPLVIYWTLHLSKFGKNRDRFVIVLILGSSISTFLSLPQHFQISNKEREIGYSLLLKAEKPGQEPNGKYIELLFKLVWDVRNPDLEWGAEYNSIKFYAMKPKAENQFVNYIIQPGNIPIPDGYTKVNEKDSMIACVKDFNLWESHKKPILTSHYRSPLFDIPPSSLFPHQGKKENPNLIDMKYQWRKRIQPLFKKLIEPKKEF
ncbi:MAG: hypothetical protein D6748_01705 [Calditrichaeota bacterium]|nr:MAG: hypothetical protein D6748_01705 [Calditrichota bacterium]